MKGYGANSYGDGMADVYDEWYHDVSDIGATVAAIAALTAHVEGRPARILELGIGTGRLALPLADAGMEVSGIDASAAMLELLARKPGAGRIGVVLGDMAGPLPEGPFDVVFVAYNTFFNLLTEADQLRCLDSVRAVMAPSGVFATELFVPHPPESGSSVEVRSLTVDRVVLNVSAFRPDDRYAEGQFVEFTEAGGVRLRPWAVRYASPAQLDALAERAGLVLRQRWGGWDRSAFDESCTRHVSVYASCD